MRYFDCELDTFLFVDGHKTGHGAMFAQGKSIADAKPVAVGSRSTSLAETAYPQLDLDAASLDFGLRRFREYLVGSPTLIKVVTDHKPLVPVFNGRRNGSIRTQRIKLKHQDIPFVVEYQKGSLNQADIMSRQARPLSSLNTEEQNEAHELNNLLYMLHATPIIDHISLAEISRKTDSDPVLSRVRDLVRKGARSAYNDDDIKVKKFNTILSELTVTGNGILLKDDRMVLPDSLQELAIQLAHKGSHPGRSGIERRLRHHFFFHDMFQKVKEFVTHCPSCAVFVDKKTKEPITPHKVPQSSWETVSVDLFGPMPSSRHVVVVQDIGSRYPAAKLVSSTKADEVIPALDEIYADYGFPDIQISDNGPPFGSKSMKEYTEARGIKTQFSAPYFPSQNPAETFMTTLGKAMKISKHDRASEEKAIKDTLKTYRQTPHISTSIPPANFIFRDGVRSEFPRKSSSCKDIRQARSMDDSSKKIRQEVVNKSKYVKHDSFLEGDLVLARNVTRNSKFEPLFLPDPFIVVQLDDDAKRVMLEGLNDSKLVIRHLDDVKGCSVESLHNKDGLSSAPPNDEKLPLQDVQQNDTDSTEDRRLHNGSSDSEVVDVHAPSNPPPRRSMRDRATPARYPEGEWSV